MVVRGKFSLGTLGRLCLLLGLLAAPLLSPVSAQDGGPLAPTLNGDQYDDLAIGHPYEDLWDGGAQNNAGAVTVFFGSGGGLALPGFETWHQGWTAENPAGYDNFFGRALAIGNFDGDEYNDLAVGIPGEDVNGKNRAGAVHVFYGTEDGLTILGDQFWHQGMSEVGGTARDHNAYGSVLAAADFDGDTYDDLAVGIPNYDVGSGEDFGAVNVLYGSEDGLSTAKQNLWFQGIFSGLADEPEEEDRFGAALGVGDFDCDGYADLAIGVPEEDLENGTVIEDAGVVHVLYGSGGGLSNQGDQLWDQDELGHPSDRAEEGDQFGYSLAGGNYDGAACTDLAVGVPYEDVSGLDAGAVNIIYSDGNSLSLALPQFWHQDLLSSATGGTEVNDRFGYALAAGDYNADGRTDLAVGAPWEDVGTIGGAGAVSVIYGSGSGLSTATGAGYFRQALTAGSSPAEVDDHFGRVLAAGDFNSNGAVDLAVGVPFEDHDPDGTRDTGIVQVLYGRPGYRLSVAQSQTWGEEDMGGSGNPQESDQFGLALAASPPPRPVSGNGEYLVYTPLVLERFRP